MQLTCSLYVNTAISVLKWLSCSDRTFHSRPFFIDGPQLGTKNWKGDIFYFLFNFSIFSSYSSLFVRSCCCRCTVVNVEENGAILKRCFYLSFMHENWEEWWQLKQWNWNLDSGHLVKLIEVLEIMTVGPQRSLNYLYTEGWLLVTF